MMFEVGSSRPLTSPLPDGSLLGKDLKREATFQMVEMAGTRFEGKSIVEGHRRFVHYPGIQIWTRSSKREAPTNKHIWYSRPYGWPSTSPQPGGPFLSEDLTHTGRHAFNGDDFVVTVAGTCFERKSIMIVLYIREYGLMYERNR